VPVALNLYKIRGRKGPAGDFFRAVQKQRPGQYQGIYVVSPAGKVLASRGSEPDKSKTWAQDLLEAMEDGLAAFGEVSRRKPAPVELLPDRGLGRRPDGSVVLAVYTRTMLLGLDRRGFGEATLDSVALSDLDRQRLEFPNLQAGDDFEVGPAVVRKLHRLLSPFSDASTLPRGDEVDRATLAAKVRRIRGGIVDLTFTGRLAGHHVGEFSPNKGKKLFSEMRLTGVGTCEAKTGKLLSLTLVGEGSYRPFNTTDKPMRYGGVVEWRLK
jgi:hypothetical protein